MKLPLQILQRVQLLGAGSSIKKADHSTAVGAGASVNESNSSFAVVKKASVTKADMAT